MLTTVEIKTALGTLLKLPLDSYSSGYVVESIEGLDPVKATLVSSSFAQIDGAQYQSSRREPRNIKLRLGLEPDFANNTVETLRTRLYEYLMPKSKVTLRFTQDTAEYVDIVARVETLETALFSNEPAIDISMMCFDPDFYVPTSVVIADQTVSTASEIMVPYLGTVETGILFTLSPVTQVNAFTIYHRTPDNLTRTMDFAGPVAAGNKLVISTLVGAKKVTKTASNVESSMLYALSPQSVWLELKPGANYIRVYSVGAQVPYTIEYTTRYGGL